MKINKLDCCLKTASFCWLCCFQNYAAENWIILRLCTLVLFVLFFVVFMLLNQIKSFLGTPFRYLSDLFLLLLDDVSVSFPSGVSSLSHDFNFISFDSTPVPHLIKLPSNRFLLKHINQKTLATDSSNFLFWLGTVGIFRNRSNLESLTRGFPSTVIIA